MFLYKAFKEVNLMGKKIMITALGLGAAYLLKNKDSRQKLMNFFQSTAEPYKQKFRSVTNTTEHS
jgi:hypothetical protein